MDYTEPAKWQDAKTEKAAMKGRAKVLKESKLSHAQLMRVLDKERRAQYEGTYICPQIWEFIYSQETPSGTALHQTGSYNLQCQPIRLADYWYRVLDVPTTPSH